MVNGLQLCEFYIASYKLVAEKNALSLLESTNFVSGVSSKDPREIYAYEKLIDIQYDERDMKRTFIAQN